MTTTASRRWGRVDGETTTMARRDGGETTTLARRRDNVDATGRSRTARRRFQGARRSWRDDDDGASAAGARRRREGASTTTR